MPICVLQTMDETIMHAIDGEFDDPTEFFDAPREQADVSPPPQTRKQDLPAPHDDGGVSMTRIVSRAVSD